MKKYKLKKDLPWLESWSIVIGIYGTNSITIYDNDNKTTSFIHNEYIDEWLSPINNLWIYKLNINDIYYSINWVWMIVEDINLDMDTLEKYRSVWNAFLTHEEAETEVKKRRFIQKIKQYCYKNNINLEYNDDESNNYSFYISEDKIEYRPDYKNGNPIWYFTEVNAKKIFSKFIEELYFILEN